MYKEILENMHEIIKTIHGGQEDGVDAIKIEARFSLSLYILYTFTFLNK